MQYSDLRTNITVRVVSSITKVAKHNYFKKVWYLENSKCILLESWVPPKITKEDKWFIVKAHGKTIIYYLKEAIDEYGYYEINTGIPSWDTVLNNAINLTWDLINHGSKHL